MDRKKVSRTLVDTATDITRILEDVRKGRDDAAAQLWQAVYSELRRMAAIKVAGESPNLTLQPTALVHEAYIRLVGSGQEDWRNRAHFFAAAAIAMRRVLIDRARSLQRLKRGGHRQRSPLSQVQLAIDETPVDLLDLDRALCRLEEIDPQKSAIVTMRYLLGCTIEETALGLGISAAKVKKDWTFAKAWLRHQLAEP